MGARGFARKSAASMLYDVLEPYHIISNGVLHSVYADPDDAWLVLNISANNSLNFRADGDDDTIWVMDGPRNESGVDVSKSAVWGEFVGKELTHGWLAMNQQGFIDSALLGFGTAIPDVCISVIASGMKVGRLGAWQRASRT
jgi:hypothetical protein